MELHGIITAQLRDTVRFADAVQHVLAESPDSTFLEVGPGRILVNLVRRAAPARKAPACVASPAEPSRAFAVGLFDANIDCTDDEPTKGVP